MFGLFRKKPKNHAEALKLFILKFASELRTLGRGWDERDAERQFRLTNLVGSSMVALRQTYPDLPVEEDSAFMLVMMHHLADPRYDETLRPWIFDQLTKVDGDDDLTLNVMAYLMAPRHFMAKAEQVGASFG